LSLENDLKEVIIRDLKIQDATPADLADDDPLFGEGLGLDSLDAVELVLLIQKHYGVEINDMEVAREAFASVKSLADYLRAHGCGDGAK